MFLLNTAKVCFITTCAVALTGCSGLSIFSSRDTNPTIHDITINNAPWRKVMLNTFANTASRRMIIVKLDDYGKTLITCAEPPPDVGEAFASAVVNAIKAKATVDKVPLEISDQYARAVATQITPLIYRTQGLQLYRDSMHSLCIDRMNGWSEQIKGEDPKGPVSYDSLKKYYFDQSIELIKLELRNIKEVGTVKKSSPKTGENPTLSGATDAATKLLNAANPAPAAVTTTTPTPVTVKKP